MLLHQVETYLRRTGTPPTTFGREAADDPRFVRDLRRGRSVGDRLLRRVQSYMDAVR